MLIAFFSLVTQAFVPCILRANDRFSAKPVKVIIAYEWQHMVLTEKADLCNNLPYLEVMKNIALESGILLIASMSLKNTA